LLFNFIATYYLMPYKNRRTNYHKFILIFVAIKVIINLFAISNYGFHRDELLHLALGDHLDWGYKEVPPFIALLAKFASSVLGGSIFATRLLTTICAGLIVWFTGLITVELGGRKFAITLACLALIFSPAFVASNYLFQPVVFDQFWWVLSVWLLIKYLNTLSVKYLYLLGAAVGFGLLTKYTMAFFTVALIAGMLLSRQRKVLLNKHVLGAAVIAILIFLPNIIWQYQHNFPVITHMKTLQSTQLDHLSPVDFIKQQLLVNGVCVFLWFAGFLALLFSFRLRKFQFLALAFIIILLFLMKMNGKSYYLFGAYPMLFAAGAYAFEKWLKTSTVGVKYAIVSLFILPNLLLFPMLLPVLPVKQSLSFFRYTNKNVAPLHFITTWEDQKQHNLTQDYADMFGWDEMVQIVAKTYHGLTPDEQKNTVIFAENYGQAGALQHYGKTLNLPQVVCLNSSFALWAPENITAKHMIYVCEDDNIDKLAAMTESYVQTGGVKNPLAREKGTTVFFLKNLKPTLSDRYKKEFIDTKKQ
jgi:hypothetical protein